MKRVLYTLFDTELGRCGIVWSDATSEGPPRVVGFQLPETNARLTEARIRARWAATKARRIAPPIQKIIKQAIRHLKGTPQDFRDVALHLEGMSPLTQAIYEAARAVPSGQTITYGELAKAAGRTGAARAVGQAMGKNPIPLIIPCHRVLAAGNRPGGFSAPGGLATKARMLEIEGVSLGRPAVIRSKRDFARAVDHLRKVEPRLAKIFAEPVDFKLRRQESPYRTLVTAVAHQQLSPKAARTILGRVTALYDGNEFPEPAQLIETQDARLRAAGLSWTKIKSIKDIAARAVDGTIPSAKEIQSLGDEALIKRLTTIHGVGRWTVEMMLIFNLGRIDVLPADDYAVRTVIGRLWRMKGVPTAGEIRKMGEAWKPFRTIVSLCLWRAQNQWSGAS